MNEYWLEPPEPTVIYTCIHCEGEIHLGEDYREVDGDKVHDEDCFLDYMREEYPSKIAGRE